MKRFFYLVSITLVSLVACTRAQELDIPDIPDDGFTIIAKTEAPAETRTPSFLETPVRIIEMPAPKKRGFFSRLFGRK